MCYDVSLYFCAGFVLLCAVTFLLCYLLCCTRARDVLVMFLCCACARGVLVVCLCCARARVVVGVLVFVIVGGVFVLCSYSWRVRVLYVCACVLHVCACVRVCVCVCE